MPSVRLCLLRPTTKSRLSGTSQAARAPSDSFRAGTAALRRSEEKGNVMETNITARIERRTWYVDGKYLGDASPWIEVAPSVIGDDTTGHCYGEWQGTKFHDGHQAIAQHVAREIENRAMLRRNHPDDPVGERFCHPCRLGDWGEYRIITIAA
jgi:hypothetical protein